MRTSPESAACAARVTSRAAAPGTRTPPRHHHPGSPGCLRVGARRPGSWSGRGTSRARTGQEGTAQSESSRSARGRRERALVALVAPSSPTAGRELVASPPSHGCHGGPGVGKGGWGEKEEEVDTTGLPGSAASTRRASSCPAPSLPVVPRDQQRKGAFPSTQRGAVARGARYRSEPPPLSGST